MFSKNIEHEVWKHALAEYPKECCGLIIDDGAAYIPMRNVHESPKNNFRMNMPEFMEYYSAGRVSALMHSHTGPDNNYPSRTDMELQANMALPWGIVHISPNKDIDGPFYFGDQVPIAPLLGRNFRPNVHDCYELLRDDFRVQGIAVLPIFPREGEWWKQGKNTLEENFTKAGFVQIDKTQLKKNDVILCKVHAPAGNPVLNHVAIVKERGLILHHLNGRLSRTDPIQQWLPTASVFLRYKGDK